MTRKARRRTKPNARTHEGRVIEVDCGRVRPYKDQPRKHFDQDKLEALAESMVAIGQLQPALVRAVEGSAKFDYELIEGERRWRACEMNGTTLRIIVEVIADKHEQFEKSMAANYNREEPPPIDTARGLQRLMESPRYRDFPITERRERIGKVCGKTGTWVSQLLSLLKLPEPVQAKFDPSDPQALPVSVGTFLAHNLTSAKDQTSIAQRAYDEGLSVAETRRLAKRLERTSGGTSARSSRPSSDWRFLERFARTLHDDLATISDMDQRALDRMMATRTDAEMAEILTMLTLGATRVAELRDKVRRASGKDKRAKATGARARA